MSNDLSSYEFIKPDGSVYTFYALKPNKCIHCFVTMDPKMIYAGKIGTVSGKFPVLYQCTNCKEHFVVPYKPSEYMDPTGQFKKAFFTDYDYGIKVNYPFPDEVVVVSNAFKDIYIQSLKAIEYALDQIAGGGLRKSIEFLVKDYLLYLDIEESEKVPGMHLADAIKLLPTERLKINAKASSWIGNDEIHYTRKFEDKDINDMMRYIRTLAYEISSDVSTKEASDFISS